MIIPDRYKSLGKPMGGGMSAVFPYHDKVLDRKVALKVVPPGPNFRRIQDELLALFKIRSKHVVQVYDVFEDTTSIGILQEFIDGDDLFSKSLIVSDVESYLKVIWQIAGGISEIHAAGLIHRDIKPNNMKIDSEGVLKIYDFGLAREDGPSAATNGFVGTHGFAAPELYTAKVKFTPAVDTYAFGVSVLYFALRSLPKELTSNPPLPLTSNPFSTLPFVLNPEVSEILYLCLSHDPQMRPKMKRVFDVISKYLLFNKHRALVVHNDKPYYLDKDRKNVKLAYGKIASVEIAYDGLAFKVSNLSGDVYINNASANVGDSLPGASVVTLGGPERGRSRAYITFDLSNPEIVL